MANRSSTFGKAAIYHRVSTRDQDPALAHHELLQAALARGFEVVIDVQETGSGARNNRPGLQRVMEASRKGQVSAVLVWKMDRFGRSALDVLSNVRQLTNAGVRFVATSQGIDVQPQGDAMSNLIVTVLAAVAEFERSLVSERTTLAARAAHREGWHWGRHREGGPEPRGVNALRATGASWSQVAKRLGCTVAMARRRAAATST